MNSAEETFRSLLGEVKILLADHLPGASDFIDGSFEEDPSLKIPDPQSLPMCDQLCGCIEEASVETLPLVRAIVAASPLLRWQQSYTCDDGFDAHYLDNYGWFNLVSPDGPFLDEKNRVSVGFWGRGLHYKEHWHEPEELYIPLAGQAIFHSHGAPARECGPGAMVVHHSNQPHSIDMLPGPLLAMALWRGTNLNRKPGLPDH
jgi:hypothetical protein